jgi:hypothetical protein
MKQKQASCTSGASASPAFPFSFGGFQMKADEEEVFIHLVTPDTEQEAKRLLERDKPNQRLLFLEKMKPGKYRAVIQKLRS